MTVANSVFPWAFVIGEICCHIFSGLRPRLTGSFCMREQHPSGHSAVSKNSSAWSLVSIRSGCVCSSNPKGNRALWAAKPSRWLKVGVQGETAQEETLPETHCASVPVPHHPGYTLMVLTTGLIPLGVLEEAVGHQEHLGPWMETTNLGTPSTSVTSLGHSEGTHSICPETEIRFFIPRR